MEFERALERYAEIVVVHGLGVQPGQVVTVAAEVCHRDLVARIAEASYRRGARLVDVFYEDPRLSRIRVLRSRDEDVEFVPGWMRRRTDDQVEERGATLRIIGSEDPDALEGLDPAKLNRARVARYRATQRFYEEGIGKSLVHWVVAGGATAAWGKKLFPGLSGEAACRRLWEEIFRICRADQEDGLAQWDVHDRELRERARRLTDLRIDELRFRGPGTDLVVGLSPKAKWLGGSDVGPYGARFEPNVPTEEVFTTPDWRQTRGHLRATRPFLVNAQRVEGLNLAFEAGRITKIEASRGADTYRSYVDSDAGARQLGEVALVGVDSPVYRSGLVFGEILYDENAACHVAVGKAYKNGLEGGPDMGEKELAEVGCNDSTTHIDMMISDEETDVVARTRSGNEVPLLTGGRWVF